MFRVRAVAPAAILVVGLSLSGCSGTSSNFDPTDWVTGEFFDTKTKLAGERKDVFPGGVPGVSEGVPKELVKGNQQQAAIDVAAPEPAPAAKPVQPAKPRAVRPATPRPQTASAPPQPAPARATPPSQPQGVSAFPDPNAQRAPQPARPAPPPAADWPDPSTQANWPPPNPSTFSR